MDQHLASQPVAIRVLLVPAAAEGASPIRVFGSCAGESESTLQAWLIRQLKSITEDLLRTPCSSAFPTALPTASYSAFLLTLVSWGPQRAAAMLGSMADTEHCTGRKRNRPAFCSFLTPCHPPSLTSHWPKPRPLPWLRVWGDCDRPKCPLGGGGPASLQGHGTGRGPKGLGCASRMGTNRVSDLPTGPGNSVCLHLFPARDGQAGDQGKWAKHVAPSQLAGCQELLLFCWSFSNLVSFWTPCL